MAKYRLAEPSDLQLHDDPLTNQLLVNRNITDKAAAESFLYPDYEAHRHDAALMPGIGIAVERILKAINDNERICVYADYDCDGIPGAVTLNDFFAAIGHNNISTYIPHRHYEGFGLHVEAVEKIAKDNVDLIITIDCGTASVAAVEKANKLGVDVIITDHHLPASAGQAGEPGEVLPEAVAIVNPKVAEGYPFKELCGAGVVFKLIEALLQQGSFDLTPGKEKWWLDMVGIATINDMVPLVGENRVLAHFGLRVLRQSRRPGLQQLLRKARANQAYLSEDDVGFTIGPRINAASRMDTPEDAFKMLSTQDLSEAGSYVDHLEKLNNERKGLVASMSKELKKRLSQMEEVPSVLVLGNPEWRPALVGLAAHKLAEEYSRPVFLWGRDGNGVIKGSCRSDGVTSIITLMEAVKDELGEFGGHHFSGGFSVKEDAIFTLPEKLVAAKEALKEDAVIDEEILIDAELSLETIDKNLFKKLRLLAPYGVGNQKPLFSFPNVVPERVEQFGKTKEHLKLVFETFDGTIEAIAFFATPESFSASIKKGEQINLLAHPEESFFMGRLQNRLRIVDVVEAV